MKTYRVYWEIFVEAESPRKAAEAARAIQNDPDNEATILTVKRDRLRGCAAEQRATT